MSGRFLAQVASIGLACALLALHVAVRAQTTGRLDLRVSETAGIRRNTYPTSTRVRFSRGVLADASHVRLLAGGKEVPAQFAAESTYPDGSVQQLAVDFNVTIGAREEAQFALEFGGGISAQALPRGLTVSQDADGVQMGNVRFGASGTPFLQSVKYRREDVGRGLNGFQIRDAAGAEHDTSTARTAKVVVVKPGPLLAVLRYSGEIPLTSGYAVGYAVNVEMPNSKSWVKVETIIADPERRVQELSFHTPLAFTSQPMEWDFGTGSWSYGLLRAPGEWVVLSQVVGTRQATRWEIRAGAAGQEQIVETTGGRRAAVSEGWGHVQDAAEVVAFAVSDFGAEAGTDSITVHGNGQISFRRAPAKPLQHLQLTVYEHFVSSPVAVGAVTSPVAMLNPLVVSFVAPR